MVEAVGRQARSPFGEMVFRLPRIPFQASYVRSRTGGRRNERREQVVRTINRGDPGVGEFLTRGIHTPKETTRRGLAIPFSKFTLVVHEPRYLEQPLSISICRVRMKIQIPLRQLWFWECCDVFRRLCVYNL